MDDITSEEKKGCTFTWKIENFIWYPFKECSYISSPAFRIHPNDSLTHWSLTVYPSKNYESIDCTLKRLDYVTDFNFSRSRLPDNLWIGFELFCVTADGKRKQMCRVKYQKFSIGDSQDFNEVWNWPKMLKKRSIFFLDDCFTIECRIWKCPMQAQPSVEYFATTQIQATRLSYQGSISIREVLSPEYHKIFFLHELDGPFIVLSRKLKLDCLSVKYGFKNDAPKKKSVMHLKMHILDSKETSLCETEENELLSGIEDIRIKNSHLLIRIDDLLQKTASLDDFFNLKFEIVLISEDILSNITEMKYENINNHKPRNVTTSSTASTSSIGEFENLYLEKKYADIQLESGKIKFPAHRNILCSRSPVFAAMLDSDSTGMRTSVIKIEDIDVATLEQLLFFLYTGRIKDPDEDMVIELLIAAHKYQVSSFKKQCAIILQSNLSVQNACQILELADLYNEETLKAAAQDFICCFHRDIFSSDEWIHFTRRHGEIASDIILKLSISASRQSVTTSLLKFQETLHKAVNWFTVDNVVNFTVTMTFLLLFLFIYFVGSVC